MLPTLNFEVGDANDSGASGFIPERAYPLAPDQDHWPGTNTDITTPLFEIPTGSELFNMDCNPLEISWGACCVRHTAIDKEKEKTRQNDFIDKFFMIDFFSKVYTVHGKTKSIFNNYNIYKTHIIS